MREGDAVEVVVDEAGGGVLVDLVVDLVLVFVLVFDLVLVGLVNCAELVLVVLTLVGRAVVLVVLTLVGRAVVLVVFTLVGRAVVLVVFTLVGRAVVLVVDLVLVLVGRAAVGLRVVGRPLVSVRIDVSHCKREKERVAYCEDHRSGHAWA